jgi:hypothetical protein
VIILDSSGGSIVITGSLKIEEGEKIRVRERDERMEARSVRWCHWIGESKLMKAVGLEKQKKTRKWVVQ